MRTPNTHKMDLHERYINLPTTESLLLNITHFEFKDEPYLFLFYLAQTYDEKIIIEDKIDLKALEILRIILCTIYKLRVQEKDSLSNVQLCKPFNKKLSDLTQLFTALDIVQISNYVEVEVLCDVIVLKMILWTNFEDIKYCFKQWSTKIAHCKQCQQKFYRKIMESFCDYLHLQEFLFSDNIAYKQKFSTLSTELRLTYIESIKCQIKEGKIEIDWISLISLLSKVISTFGFKDIAIPIWELILCKSFNIETSLELLCSAADIYFPLEPQYEHQEMCFREEFWLLLLDGIKLPVQQYRKQALYIMKRASIVRQKMELMIFPSINNSIIPFACSHSHESKLLNDFFLIMEALEEKQMHLILPVLSRIKNLVTPRCSNVIWLHCIFERIMNHESKGVIRWGVLELCKLDADIYNSEFLCLFAKALNNTFLYECRNNNEVPEMVEELIGLLIRTQKQRTDFFKEFLNCICSIYTWNPVAICYITQAIYVASCGMTDVVLCCKDLENIKDFILACLKVHSHIFRDVCKTNMLNTITNVIKDLYDTEILTKALLTFSLKDIIRNSHLWNIIVTWLKQTLLKTTATNFIKQICNKYILNTDYSSKNTELFAYTIFLLYDANLILTEKECIVEQALKQLSWALEGLDTRSYADTCKTFYLINIICDINTLSVMKKCNRINLLLSSSAEPILKYLLHYLKSAHGLCFTSNPEEYLKSVILFLNTNNSFLPKNKVLEYVNKFHEVCVHMLKGKKCIASILNYGLSYVLYYCQSILLSQPGINPNIIYVEPVDAEDICRFHIGSLELGNKILIDFEVLLGKIMCQYLEHVSQDIWLKDIDITSLLHCKLLRIYSMDMVLVVGKILQICIDKKIYKNLDDIDVIFENCWNYAFNKNERVQFWDVIDQLLKIIINPNFLILPGAINFIKPFIDTLLEKGENMPRLKILLLSNMESLNKISMKDFQEPLLACLLHGYALRRDKRIENQAFRYIMKNYGDYLSRLSLIDYNEDAAVRASATVLLLNTINNNSEFTSSFLKLVLAQLTKNKNKRYFNDSQLHRIKQRLMQILLIMEPVLNESNTTVLHDTMHDLLLAESNQHSVRLLQEWLLIRIYKKNKDLQCKLWEFFEKSMVERPGCTTSAASILYHITQLLMETDIQEEFIKKSIPYVSSCCLGPQFNVRLYNQLVFMKLYELSQKSNYFHIIRDYKGLYEAINKCLDQEVFAKKLINLWNDFFFTVFHPINDYTLQTIYYELPRLCNMEADERITPELFEFFKFTHRDDYPLQLRNLNQSLESYKINDNSTGLSEDQTSVESQDNVTSLDDDMQKKINPLQFLKLLDDEAVEEGLIVVASLVDKLPNLGGLARTCEIFGVKELVIANFNDTKHKEFQSLSVTAEKWINIVEIKSHDLQDYLIKKKYAGWSLFGAEQTVRSKNLTEVKFDKKCVLVLGNEKTGIPANLISLLDTCIEIPQFGVIRSLNVHVTASICIWQYINEHMLSKENEKR